MTNTKYLFLLLFLPLSLYAQNQNRIVALKKKLETSTNQQRYDDLSDLAWEYRFANPDSTLFYCVLYSVRLALVLKKSSCDKLILS